MILYLTITMHVFTNFAMDVPLPQPDTPLPKPEHNKMLDESLKAKIMLTQEEARERYIRPLEKATNERDVGQLLAIYLLMNNGAAEYAIIGNPTFFEEKQALITENMAIITALQENLTTTLSLLQAEKAADPEHEHFNAIIKGLLKRALDKLQEINRNNEQRKALAAANEKFGKDVVEIYKALCDAKEKSVAKTGNSAVPVADFEKIKKQIPLISPESAKRTCALL